MLEIEVQASKSPKKGCIHWYTTIVYMIYKAKNLCRCLEAEVCCIRMVYRLIYMEKGQNMTHIQRYTSAVYTGVSEQK